MLLVLAILTARRVLEWRTEAQLWASAVTITPNNPRALINLGVAWERIGVPPMAHTLYQRAWQAAEGRPRQEDIQLLAETNMATTLAAMNRREDAVRMGAGVLARRPMYRPAVALVQRLPWEDPECHP